MDIFDLLQNDPQLTPQKISEISTLQIIFSLFSSLLDSLFCFADFSSLPFLTAARKSPSCVKIIAPYLSSLYQQRLDSAIFSSGFQRVQGFLKAGDLGEFLEYLAEFYKRNKNFLTETAEVWSEDRAKSLISCLKERFLVLFVKENSFSNVVESSLYQALFVFQRKMLDFLQGKLEEPLLAKIAYYFASQAPIQIKSQAFENQLELIAFFTQEFGIVDDVRTLLLKLLTESLAGFMKNQTSEGFDFENNELLADSVQFSQGFLNTFLQHLGSLAPKTPIFGDIINGLSVKLEFAISERFFITCKDKIFDMIMAYPDSAKLIFDLHSAVSTNSAFLFELSDCLLASINKRLLIPGVITQSILNQYINILKVLQLLDKGLIFAKVTNPIKSYLLKRTDTLRCIIAHLTEDSENYTKLVKEYVKIPSKEEHQYELSSDEDEVQAEKWEVLPLLSKKNSLIRIKYQESDLVSVLVNLYGSQEAFINEYQRMLAEKLLGAKEFNIEEEIKNIELLKLRFGENSLQNCNIIVKDVKESKRIDQNLHQNFDGERKTFRGHDLLTFEKLHCMFASKGYWPINYESEANLKLPTFMTSVFEDYSAKFSKVKAMRKLIWHNQLGFVNLTLSFDNGDFEFKCLPIHAVLIGYFDESKCNEKIGVSSEFISKDLGQNASLVKRKMAFWVHKRVLREFKNLTVLKGHYNLDKPGLKKGLLFQEKNPFFSYSDPDTDNVIYFPNKVYEKPASEDEELGNFDELEDNSGILIKDLMNSADFEANQFNSMIEGLIMSMLTTNGPKNAEKIFNLLRTVYKTNVSYPYNENQTKEILRTMLMKQKIAFNGELYSAIN